VHWAALGTTFVTLTVIMDPVGIAPIFIVTTARLEAGARQRAAMRAVLAAGALILGFALFGGLVLDYLNVSVDSLSIAGGLLLLLVALEMLRGMDYPDADGSGGAPDVALVPLATPLLAGPGAIATVIVLMRSEHQFGGKASVLLGILGALAVVGIVMFAAERLSRFIPESLIQFLTRVFGLLLSAIAVQLVVNGVRGIVQGS
jgi:multiple antibiotic resistance protein